MLLPRSHSGRIWRGARSGRVCSAGSSCGQGLGAKGVEAKSAECKDCRWGGGRSRKNQAGGDDGRLGAGLESVLDIRMNNLDSILEGNISVQS